MALRSGYYGLKNATKKILEKLAVDTAGMKIIKSFGDGLSLSNAGKLSVTAGSASKIGGFKVGSGLSVNDGVLSALGGDDYSTLDEQLIGTFEGKDLYRKMWELSSVNLVAGTWYTVSQVTLTGVECITKGSLAAIMKTGKGFSLDGFYCSSEEGHPYLIHWRNLTIDTTASGTTYDKLYLILEYTKSAE